MYALTASRPARQQLTPIVATEVGTSGDWSSVDILNGNVKLCFRFAG